MDSVLSIDDLEEDLEQILQWAITMKSDDEIASDFFPLMNMSIGSIYEKPSTLTYEASIRTMLLKDYYITMSNIDRSEYYNIKFQKKPFMVWIWISVIFISMGGFIRLFKRLRYLSGILLETQIIQYTFFKSN